MEQVFLIHFTKIVILFSIVCLNLWLLYKLSRTAILKNNFPVFINCKYEQGYTTGLCIFFCISEIYCNYLVLYFLFETQDTNFWTLEFLILSKWSLNMSLRCNQIHWMTMTTATHINPKSKNSQVRMMCILKY